MVSSFTSSVRLALSLFHGGSKPLIPHIWKYTQNQNLEKSEDNIYFQDF